MSPRNEERLAHSVTKISDYIQILHTKKNLILYCSQLEPLDHTIWIKNPSEIFVTELGLVGVAHTTLASDSESIIS
jgi:hypothetical protein